MRTWAEIDLDAIKHNIKEIRRVTSSASKIMAVIKADAYGHGYLEIAETLANNGADCFAVAMADEALQIRKAGFFQDVLVLGGVDEGELLDLIENDITLTVYSMDFAEVVSRIAVGADKTAKIHIKLDTGMSRIGYVIGEGNDRAVAEEIVNISKLPNIFVEGIFSHLSTSDEADGTYTRLQFERFIGIVDTIKGLGLDIPIKHIANSAAIMSYPQMHLDMVRPGIILYGLYPSDDVDKNIISLKPAMTLKAKITHVKELSCGRGVGYGKTYITDAAKKIATVPIGYADGYPRLLAKDGQMLVQNEKVNIIGRICMDQCMIDVTNVNNISTGDEVTVFTSEIITADDLAHWALTINYEIVCMISKRIPRIYLEDGRTVREVNYLI